MKQRGNSVDYYRLFRVPVGTHPDRIKALYRELARQHHPDVRGSSVDNLGWFQDLTAAYHTLSDAGRKAAYDAERMQKSRRDRRTASVKLTRRVRRRAPAITPRSRGEGLGMKRLLRPSLWSLW